MTEETKEAKTETFAEMFWRYVRKNSPTYHADEPAPIAATVSPTSATPPMLTSATPSLSFSTLVASLRQCHVRRKIHQTTGGNLKGQPHHA